VFDRGRFVFDSWSRAGGPLHRLDARWKILATLPLLLWISWSPRPWEPCAALLVLTLAGRLPLGGLAARAALVLPFTIVFAAATAWMGDAARALLLMARAYLSACTVALLMASTPLERLLDAAARLGAPRLLTEVMHFTWRYLTVIGAQAARLRIAAQARGGGRSFRVSAQSVAVLFAGSYHRAERIHRAMVARGATGGRL
jgi:cobalt/nickel transport system permease protein